jgi:chromosomal replication initiator protein
MSQPNSLPSERQYREQLKTNIGQRPYNMWLSNTKITFGVGKVEIIAQTQLGADWLVKRYNAPIEDATFQLFGNTTEIQIRAAEKSTTIDSQHATHSHVVTKPKTKRTTGNLLSFDDFVVGKCNQLAHAASKQITHEDGRSISPLFIHGGCGVGKTHLLQSICKHAMRTTSDKVKYITAEHFTNDFIQSSRFGEFERFRNRYRFLDLLCIDDVHFVKRKIKTQEELLHTLDAAGLRGARLVLASDEDPRLITQLNKALANRFVAGMVVEIERPDKETRQHIIERITQKQRIALTPGAIRLLASQAVSSVREIEGTVTTLRATASLLLDNMTDSIGTEIVDRVLRSTPVNSLPVKFSHILEEICKRSRLSVQDIRGKSRTATFVFWRSMAYHLGRKLTNLSYPELAFSMGRKNHSTVHTSVKNMRIFLEQGDTTRKVGNETIEVSELIESLIWAVRLRANREG